MQNAYYTFWPIEVYNPDRSKKFPWQSVFQFVICSKESGKAIHYFKSYSAQEGIQRALDYGEENGYSIAEKS